MLDEKNQYGYGMTKPLPTGCTKHNSNVRWRTFNLLLQNLSLITILAIFMWSILNLIIKKPQKTKLFTMKYIRLLLKIRKLLIHVRGQCINYLDNIQQLKKEIHKHIGQRKKHIQQCSKRYFNQCI